VGFGVKRLDTSLTENEPPISWEYPEDEIPDEFDQYIDALNENGIAVNYLLHYWDKEGHENGEQLSTPRFQSQDQIQDFRAYVSDLVEHFGDRIQYYTIWTEPDYCGDDGIKCIETQDYINLAKEIIPIIKANAPQAKIGMAPYVLFFAREEVFKILSSDVIDDFDVIQWHGIYDVFPGNEFFGNYYYDYPTIIERMKATASDNGFNGEYWGTELTWCSQLNPDCLNPPRPWRILETGKQATKYTARFFVMQMGIETGVGWPTYGDISQGWMWPTIRNLNTTMAGARPTHIEMDINSPAENLASYAFALPNDDLLFALWTDGEAMIDDKGIETSLTIPNLTSDRIVGIDVLYGFEQELDFQIVNGKIYIERLMVKDYPTIIKIIDPTP